MLLCEVGCAFSFLSGAAWSFRLRAIPACSITISLHGRFLERFAISVSYPREGRVIFPPSSFRLSGSIPAFFRLNSQIFFFGWFALG